MNVNKKTIIISGFLITLAIFNAQRIYAATVEAGCVVVEVGKATIPFPKDCENLNNNSSSGTNDGKNHSSAGPTTCTGNLVIVPNVQKYLLPLPSEKNCDHTSTHSCGRRADICIKPTKIIMHTTWGYTGAKETYEYFANGSSGRGVGTQFIIGKDGKIIQMTELLDSTVEMAYGISNYNRESISIELGHTANYSGRNQVPQAQYQAAISLVKFLMTQYNIPVGNLEFNWKSPSNSKNPNAGAGVYGHYQLNPETKSDPGSGFMRDFREDLKR